MRLNQEQQSDLAIQIWNFLEDQQQVTYIDKQKALLIIKNIFDSYEQREKSIGLKAKEKINHLKRTVPEGSAEWQTLYQKYYEEESRKAGF